MAVVFTDGSFQIRGFYGVFASVSRGAGLWPHARAPSERHVRQVRCGTVGLATRGTLLEDARGGCSDPGPRILDPVKPMADRQDSAA
jgi:hypothetical protein